MPYIKKNNRKKFDEVLNNLPEMKSKGELEYVVFKIMKQFMKNREFRYTPLHSCVYAVMHCADEFRRCYLDKREDKARKTNGDINSGN